MVVERGEKQPKRLVITIIKRVILFGLGCTNNTVLLVRGMLYNYNNNNSNSTRPLYAGFLLPDCFTNNQLILYSAHILILAQYSFI